MTSGAVIVLGVTGDLGFAAGTFLAGFHRHNPSFAGEVVILHDGLLPQDRAALSGITPRLRLEDFDADRAIARLGATADLPVATITRALSRWSPMILAKFEMFDWLDRYDTAVWFDADMLVQAPLDDLWQAGPLAWRALAEGALLRRARVLGQLEDLILTHDTPLPNGGLVVAQRVLRDRWGIAAADLYRMAAHLLQRTRATTIDELSLFLLTSNRGLPVTALDPDLNHSVAQEGSGRARILHAIGPDKFWNAAPLRQACPQWQADHDLWLAAGGSPAPAASRMADLHGMTPDVLLAQARNRSFWDDLWRWLGPQLPLGLWPDLRSERTSLRLYPTGGDRRNWLELARLASDKRLRVSVGLDHYPRRDRGETEHRLAQALTASGLTLEIQRRRRATSWATEVSLTEVSATLQRLRDALVATGS